MKYRQLNCSPKPWGEFAFPGLWVTLASLSCFFAAVAATLAPLPVAAQTTSLCSGVSPTSVTGTTAPRQLSHPEFEAKGWKVMLRTGPSMDCGASPIWAQDNLRVEELGVYVGSDQSWSLLRFADNGSFKQRWAETRFLENVAGSGGCSGASPSNRFSAPRSKQLSHPEFEARGWKVMLRTGPSMDCNADPIWANDNLQVMELGTYAASDQSWSLLQFSHNGATKQRWAETRFLEGSGGMGGCYGASPSTVFNSPHSRTLSHPEYEARGWKVMLRTGPSMDCDADPIWADDNLQVMELGTYAASDQSWSLLQFSHNGATEKRWAETRFLEIAGGAGGCSGASPSTRYDSPRSRLLSHPEYEAKRWKVMLRTGPSMDCGSDPIWADDNLPVEEIGVYAGEDQSWSLLRFYRNGGVMERWAETRFLDSDSTGNNDTSTPVKPPPGGMPVVIYDTDMGPDIDDALALAALHTYANKGMAHIAAVTLSRNSDMGARYIDLLNTFYARPDIPVGVYRGNTSTDKSESGYTRDIVNSGKYPYSLNTSTLPLGHLLMRDVLLSAPDNSVVIIQVGFSTNTARLLAEYPDLVARKVRLLSVMAGDFIIGGGSNGSDSFSEFNVRIHPSSARLVFDGWPNEVVVSEFHLGNNILYPLSSIRNDFGYVRNHPIKDSYLNSTYDWHRANGDSYDMKSWDITSVIAAIEPGVIPRVLGPGKVTVSNDNRTSFRPGAGRHFILAEAPHISGAQRQELVELMVHLVSSPPNSTVEDEPAPVPSPAPAPQRNLAVSIPEDPFRCNGVLRSIAQVSGFDRGEQVVVAVNGRNYPARSAPDGVRTVSWRCQNGGAPINFTAVGESSRLRAVFSVDTFGSTPSALAPAPVCRPAVKREYPGREIIDRIIKVHHTQSYREPLEPFEDGCRSRAASRSFDEGERVQIKGYAGGYVELVGGGWIRRSATDAPDPVPSPAPKKPECRPIALKSYTVKNGKLPFNDSLRTDVLVRGFVEMKEGDKWFMKGKTDSARKAIEIKPKMRAFTGAQEIYLTKDGGYKPLDFDPTRSDLISFIAGGDGRGAPRTPICEFTADPGNTPLIPPLPWPKECHFGKGYQASSLSDAMSEKLATDLELVFCPAGAELPNNLAQFQQCGEYENGSAHGRNNCGAL